MICSYSLDRVSSLSSSLGYKISMRSSSVSKKWKPSSSFRQVRQFISANAKQSFLSSSSNIVFALSIKFNRLFVISKRTLNFFEFFLARYTCVRWRQVVKRTMIGRDLLPFLFSVLPILWARSITRSGTSTFNSLKTFLKTFLTSERQSSLDSFPSAGTSTPVMRTHSRRWYCSSLVLPSLVFVLNNWLREISLSAVANCFDLRCEQKQFLLLCYKICPC